MIGFDYKKYSLDHEWKDCLDKETHERLEIYYSQFIIAYEITCVKCGLFIGHEEVDCNKNTPGFTAQMNNSLFWVADKRLNKLIVKNNFRDGIDYSKIYSCAEMLIKDIIE